MRMLTRFILALVRTLVSLRGACGRPLAGFALAFGCLLACEGPTSTRAAATSAPAALVPAHSVVGAEPTVATGPSAAPSSVATQGPGPAAPGSTLAAADPNAMARVANATLEQRVAAACSAPDEHSAVLKTLALIEHDGPYPFDRDGIEFRNLEGRLPREGRGYYREFTVPTAGSRTRGARRVIAGKFGELYYTRDHYESFTALRDKRTH